MTIFYTAHRSVRETRAVYMQQDMTYITQTQGT